MSTKEVLNSIADAIAAYEVKPGLEMRIRSLEDDLAYAQLEIEELKRKNADQAEIIRVKNDQIDSYEAAIIKNEAEIKSVQDENKSLEVSLHNVRLLAEDRLEDWRAASSTIELQKARISDLEQRLFDARSYSERLAETLKSIGASIVSAVAVPEVTTEKPFQVSGTVAVSVQTDAGDTGSFDPMANASVAEPAGQDLVTNDPVEPKPEIMKYW